MKDKNPNVVRTRTDEKIKNENIKNEVERTDMKNSNKDPKSEMTNVTTVKDNNKNRVSKIKCKRVTWADVVRGDSKKNNPMISAY